MIPDTEILHFPGRLISRALLLLLSGWAFAIGTMITGALAADAPAGYAGTATCAECHKNEAALWKGSDHDWAMKPATRETVLGDFNGAKLTHHGITSRFAQRNGKFLVTTIGQDNKPHEYEIAYTFGHFPLQQYLVAFPGGRLQALPLAWDSRQRSKDGQRWFHLYPGEDMTTRSPLFWTRPDQTWNFMCAECHSTRLEKNYDPASDSYATTWAEINVGCEGCHGPGAAHAAWAASREKNGSSAGDNAADKGLTVDLRRDGAGSWVFGKDERIAHLTKKPDSRAQIDTCGFCHSRRASIGAEWHPGASLLQTHFPALPEEPLYELDGQIRDEVYSWGSFLQSRMYGAGVVCSDCHDPHALKLKAQGNEVCGQCHRADVFDTAKHHFHKRKTKGADCVSCHMPARTYMGVDRRHDHSFRIPRPDQTLTLGVPNSCNNCHVNKSPAWADAQLEEWYGPDRRKERTYAEAFHAAREGLPDAAQALRDVALDPGNPGIARAAAIAGLQMFPAEPSLQLLEEKAADEEPLVRWAVARDLRAVSPEARVRIGAGLLSDPVRAVRIEAAQAFATLPPGILAPGNRDAYVAALGEYRAMLSANDDRPETHFNFALLARQMGRAALAEAALRKATQRDETFMPAYIALAESYRARGDTNTARSILTQAAPFGAHDADLSYAEALLLIDEGKRAEAAKKFAEAAARAPGNARYVYVHAISVHDEGDGRKALAILEEAASRFPNDRLVLRGAADYAAEAGAHDKALGYARRLLALLPDDAGTTALVNRLEEEQKKKEAPSGD
ncbi:MAG: hypothetical protein CVT83_01105 [Alphaproteobacteria bacterium HGW-Alphaproteobacteria-5]|nr:MAG: hypothetical protein CVT83_01105 [Alphaproteobacteria bacterium HGW-Alphaproteobacteria-5]